MSKEKESDVVTDDNFQEIVSENGLKIKDDLRQAFRFLPLLFSMFIENIIDIIEKETGNGIITIALDVVIG